MSFGNSGESPVYHVGGNVLYDATGLKLATLGSALVNSVTGTTNQVTASPTTGAVVLSLPSTLVVPGQLSVASGGITVFSGLTPGPPQAVQGRILRITTAGALGIAGATGQSCTVTNTLVTANTNFLISCMDGTEPRPYCTIDSGSSGQFDISFWNYTPATVMNGPYTVLVWLVGP